MAKFVLTSEFISIASNDLSAYGVSGELSLESEAKEVTNYASGGWKEFLGGLKSGSLKLKLLQDVAASAIDSIMFPLLGTVVAFEVRATSAVVGTSNPKYTGSLLINAWNPIEGGVGDEASVSLTYPTSGAVARATS